MLCIKFDTFLKCVLCVSVIHLIETYSVTHYINAATQWRDVHNTQCITCIACTALTLYRCYICITTINFLITLSLYKHTTKIEIGTLLCISSSFFYSIVCMTHCSVIVGCSIAPSLVALQLKFCSLNIISVMYAYIFYKYS